VGEKELEFVRAYSWQWVFQHEEAELVIERQGPRVLSIGLKNVECDLGTIEGFEG